MRKMSLTLVLGLGLASTPFVAAAQSVPRILQCEGCTPQQMEELALDLGQIAGGSFHVFSLRQQALSRYWVDYDHAAKRWVATAVSPHQGMVDVFGHMSDAYASRPSVLTGRQVFRAGIDAIGGAHDPVRVSIRGRHDSAYGRFIDAARECFDDASCAAGVDPALGAILLARKQARRIGLLLFDGVAGGVAWEGPPPRPAVFLCSVDEDCAVLEYRDDEWTYVETRGDGGSGKRYPVYGDIAHYAFDDAASAASFERSLRNAGGRVEGAWQPGADLVCRTAYASANCDYQAAPSGRRQPQP